MKIGVRIWSQNSIPFLLQLHMADGCQLKSKYGCPIKEFIELAEWM
jgi:hypothetical protein